MFFPIGGQIRHTWHLRARILFILFAGFLLTTGTTRADDNIYKFAGTTFPLIFEQDDHGNHFGLAVDILREISQNTGMTFKTLHYPWARALAAARGGTIDGLIGPYWSEERADYLDFSTHHFYSDRMVFVSRRTSTVTWTGDLRKLAKERILAVRGWDYGPEFNTLRRQLRLTLIPRFDLGPGMLIADRADLLAANERNALFELKRQGLGDRLAILHPAFHQTHGYFGFPKVKNDKVLQARFNKALEMLWASGKLSAMSARYQLAL